MQVHWGGKKVWCSSSSRWRSLLLCAGSLERRESDECKAAVVRRGDGGVVCRLISGGFVQEERRNVSCDVGGCMQVHWEGGREGRVTGGVGEGEGVDRM